MTDTESTDTYGTLISPTTLKIQRHLPGPIERVWSYLIESDLRRKWLAAGDIDLGGSEFELVWRNDELGNGREQRPAAFPEEQRMKSVILECDPPRKLVISWGDGDVSFELTPAGKRILLTLIHRRLDDHGPRVMIGAGWHAHLDFLAAELADDDTSESFWLKWGRLREVYDKRFAG
jgi:uncharacterized protein YndB with AHSA1/START domain